MTRSGQAASGIRPYKYRDMLSFLQQSFEERNTISSIDHPREPAQNEDAGLSDDLDNDEDEVVGHEPESQLIQPRHPTSKNLARKKSPYARKKKYETGHCFCLFEIDGFPDCQKNVQHRTSSGGHVLGRNSTGTQNVGSDEVT